MHATRPHNVIFLELGRKKGLVYGFRLHREEEMSLPQWATYGSELNFRVMGSQILLYNLTSCK